VDINIIRKQYPNPSQANTPRITDAKPAYCIGGAICMFYNLLEHYGWDGRFPDKLMLRDILRKANPLLNERTAHNHAVMIIAWNDEGLFQEGWREAGIALTYTPPTES
jgi:hypothetical protein